MKIALISSLLLSPQGLSVEDTPMRKKVVCLILGGGRGTRLFPLTKSRSKPAVPIAGKYRLIDIPIANCIHSGLNRIFVLTQFNSVSLHRHIANSYKFDSFGGGFVEILAAQQTMQHESWYQGTADAVRRNLPYFSDHGVEMVLILSGDQLYRMNFQEMIEEHVKSKADATIATLPVDERTAASCGIMKIDAAGRITDFLEKPKTPEALAKVRTDPDRLERHGVESKGRAYLASMGIYLFNYKTLVELLEENDATDFGKELFPHAIPRRRVQSYLFDDYWEDIGTIGSFHQANIDLTKDDPPIDFAMEEHLVYTRPRFLPCSRLLGGVRVDHALIGDGCEIRGGTVIEHSVVGLRTMIEGDVTIKRSYIMGADDYEMDADLIENDRLGRPPIGIGAGCQIEGAIIDKNARIGAGSKIINVKGVTDFEGSPDYVIRDGVIVIPKNAVIPEGTVI